MFLYESEVRRIVRKNIRRMILESAPTTTALAPSTSGANINQDPVAPQQSNNESGLFKVKNFNRVGTIASFAYRIDSNKDLVTLVEEGLITKNDDGTFAGVGTIEYFKSVRTGSGANAKRTFNQLNPGDSGYDDHKKVFEMYFNYLKAKKETAIADSLTDMIAIKANSRIQLAYAKLEALYNSRKVAEKALGSSETDIDPDLKDAYLALQQPFIELYSNLDKVYTPDAEGVINNFVDHVGYIFLPQAGSTHKNLLNKYPKLSTNVQGALKNDGGKKIAQAYKKNPTKSKTVEALAQNNSAGNGLNGVSVFEMCDVSKRVAIADGRRTMYQMLDHYRDEYTIHLAVLENGINNKNSTTYPAINVNIHNKQGGFEDLSFTALKRKLSEMQDEFNKIIESMQAAPEEPAPDTTTTPQEEPTTVEPPVAQTADSDSDQSGPTGIGDEIVVTDEEEEEERIVIPGIRMRIEAKDPDVKSLDDLGYKEGTDVALRRLVRDSVRDQKKFKGLDSINLTVVWNEEGKCIKVINRTGQGRFGGLESVKRRIKDFFQTGVTYAEDMYYVTNPSELPPDRQSGTGIGEKVMKEPPMNEDGIGNKTWYLEQVASGKLKARKKNFAFKKTLNPFEMIQKDIKTGGATLNISFDLL